MVYLDPLYHYSLYHLVFTGGGGDAMLVTVVAGQRATAGALAMQVSLFNLQKMSGATGVYRRILYAL